jgi:nitrogenase molybdenum-iron protein alpha/beta subunit
LAAAIIKGRRAVDLINWREVYEEALRIEDSGLSVNTPMTGDDSTERFDRAHRPEHVEGLAEVR